MSEQDVEALRALYDAFNRCDLQPLLDGFDPEIEVEETEDLGYAALLLRVLGPRFVILSGRYQGIDEVRRLFESVWEIAEWFRVQPLELVEAEGRVVVPLRMEAKAKDTGIVGEALAVHLWRMREGRGVRLQVFPDVESAISAARAQNVV
jgi:ketosteroid isomerase-like protein